MNELIQPVRMLLRLYFQPRFLAHVARFSPVSVDCDGLAKRKFGNPAGGSWIPKIGMYNRPTRLLGFFHRACPKYIAILRTFHKDQMLEHSEFLNAPVAIRHELRAHVITTIPQRKIDAPRCS